MGDFLAELTITKAGAPFFDCRWHNMDALNVADFEKGVFDGLQAKAREKLDTAE